MQVSDGRSGTASEVVDITVHDIAPLPVSARASSSFAIALTLSEVVTSEEQGPNGFSVTTGRRSRVGRVHNGQWHCNADTEP